MILKLILNFFEAEDFNAQLWGCIGDLAALDISQKLQL
jgi:hypothetical protein